eukprot:313931-Amphidinium_carterae.1
MGATHFCDAETYLLSCMPWANLDDWSQPSIACRKQCRRRGFKIRAEKMPAKTSFTSQHRHNLGVTSSSQKDKVENQLADIGQQL